jgi:MFS family permease
MTVQASADPGSSSAVRSALRETWASLASVFRNPRLRRIQLALVGSMIGDWAAATAITVWAYGVGGAKAVGIYVAVRMLAMAISAPFAGNLADRLPRKAVMIGADLTRAVMVSAAALCLYVDTPAAPVFALAIAMGIFGCLFRPAQAAWLPVLADRPEELTASNGASSTIESVSFFIGPALGASLVAISDVQTVLLFDAVTFVWSAALVLGIHAPSHPENAANDAEEEESGGALKEMAAGFSQIWRDKDLLVVAYVISAQTIIAGAEGVFAVLFAVDYLKTGAQGVGWINSIFGVGAILGGFYAIGRASANKLAWDMTVGAFFWSAPLLLIVLWPNPLVVFATVALMGFANPLVDVNFYTLVQRICPDRVLGRVFGALEGLLIGTMALGAAAFPLLVSWMNLKSALTVIAVVVAAPLLLLIPKLRSMDRRISAPAGLPLLKAIPMFAPLGPATLNGLANKLVRIEVAAGEVVIREGEASDRFYVIESGSVSATHEGVVLRHEGAGEFFGEIGLLRDVARTANIIADEPTVLMALERDDFLNAVTGQDDSLSAAESVVARRLGGGVA